MRLREAVRLRACADIRQRQRPRLGDRHPEHSEPSGQVPDRAMRVLVDTGREDALEGLPPPVNSRATASRRSNTASGSSSVISDGPTSSRRYRRRSSTAGVLVELARPRVCQHTTEAARTVCGELRIAARFCPDGHAAAA